MKQLHKSSERKCYHKLRQRSYRKQRANDFEKADGVKGRDKAGKFNIRNNETTKEKEREKLRDKTDKKKTSSSK